MRLSEVLAPQAVIAELQGRSKREVLRELVEVLPVNSEQALRALWERERLGSTAIGQGVAIPHARLQGLNRPLASFGRSQQGVDFESMDGQPVHLIFLIGTPLKEVNRYLKLLAGLSRLLRQAEVREALMSAQKPSEVREALMDAQQVS